MYANVKIENITLNTLVDSCASGFAFLSESCSQKLNLSPHYLNSHTASMGFEGKSQTKITKQVKIYVALGNYSQEMSGFATPYMKYDIVLDLPWLEKYSSYVNWREHAVTFEETCLESSCCKFETTIPYHNNPSLAARETPNHSLYS